MDVTCKWEQDRADPFTGEPYFKTQCGHTIQPMDYRKYFTFPTRCIHCKKMILEVADLFGPTDRRPSEEQMPCPNCGGTLIGDGVTMVRHCENVDLDALDCRPEPDADPVYCEEDKVKPSNCGRFGLEPVELEEVPIINGNGETVGSLRTYGCPVDDINETRGKTLQHWNATQFALKTERINAAAVAITSAGFGDADYFVDVVSAAERLIEIQDERARVRWAEMQKGE